MSAQNIEIKAFEEKVNAQLEQAKEQLGEFEARVKGKGAQAEIDTINDLKHKHREIDRKRLELKTLGDAKAGQAKAEIDADVAKLKSSLADLATKLKKAG
jgi:hypothetical protein